MDARRLAIAGAILMVSSLGVAHAHSSSPSPEPRVHFEVNLFADYFAKAEHLSKAQRGQIRDLVTRARAKKAAILRNGKLKPGDLAAMQNQAIADAKSFLNENQLANFKGFAGPILFYDDDDAMARSMIGHTREEMLKFLQEQN